MWHITGGFAALSVMCLCSNDLRQIRRVPAGGFVRVCAGLWQDTVTYSVQKGRKMSALKWWGGKHYLAPWIISHMPPHRNYVEPFFGGGQVLFAKEPEGISEVANDIDGELMNFWRVLQHADQFSRLKRRLEATPFAEQEFELSITPHLAGEVERAAMLFVRCRQSLAGRGKTFAPVSKTRTRRGMNEQVSAWLAAIDGLPDVHARLRRVLILNRPALGVIREFDGPDTLFYLDPPYLHETRAAADVYRYEMTATDHAELLARLRTLRGRVILSGYPSALYDTELAAWRRVTRTEPNHAAGGESKREMTEVLWMNF